MNTPHKRHEKLIPRYIDIERETMISSGMEMPMVLRFMRYTNGSIRKAAKEARLTRQEMRAALAYARKYRQFHFVVQN